MYCYDDTSMIRDDHFGMVPRKNLTKTHVKTINSALIYQTTYGARTDWSFYEALLCPPFSKGFNRHMLQDFCLLK